MTPQPIAADCRPAARQAYRQSGPRPESDIRLVVLHVAEAPSAHGVADYFASTSAGGSAHVVVDDEECVRCLPNHLIPWGAPGANESGLHIEICGYAAWSGHTWHHHPVRLDRAAYRAARWAHRYGLPPVMLTHRGLAAGRRGITTHHAVNRWQSDIGAPGDHSHTCPFPAGTVAGHFPLAYVADRIRHYHRLLG